MAGMSGLPDVPDPTKVANSIAEGAKIVADQATLIGQSLVEGVSKIAVTGIKGAMVTTDHVAKDFITGVESAVSTGKATADTIKGAFKSTAEGLRNQVDQGIGGEVVRKFKSETERMLR